MGRRSFPGGIITATETTVNGYGARGMWSTQTHAQKKNSGLWPIPGITPSGPVVGPTIANVAVTDSNYTVLNDTPYIDSAGGYIKISGTGFASGAVVYVGGSAAVTTSFVSSTEVRAQVAAGATSNSFPVYVVNTDSSVAIKLAAVTYSGLPSWVTSAALSDQVIDSAFSISLSATGDSAITYSLAAGSTLPPGTALSSGGVFSGTVTGLSVDTAYSFSVVANDAENQDSSRTFTVNVSIGDQYFNLTPLLLNGEANVWITDASTNKFLPTIFADTRPTAFHPYSTYWSGFFDGTGDFLTIGNNSLLAFGTSAYTIEFWFNGDPSIADYKGITGNATFALYFNSSSFQIWNGGSQLFAPTMNPLIPRARWTFLQIIRTSTASNGLSVYVDGVIAATGTDGTNWTGTGTTYFFSESGSGRPSTGFVTDLRVSSVARTPGVPTAPLSSDANTRLLTLQNRRFIDNSSNASTITPSGDAAIKTFNPYTITETDTTTGSGYFDGTGDYLSIGTAANWVSLHNTAAQWTMDFWVYPITYNGSLIQTCDSSTQTGIFLGFAAGGLVVLQIMRGVTSSFVMNVTGSVSAPLNAWSHIQISYDYNLASDNVAIYVNGTVNTASAGSFTKTANAPSSSNPTSPLYVGYSSASQFRGYITDLRIRTGIAVSTAPTLPTTSVSSNANTQLLILQYRRGDNNHRFVDESGIRALTTRAGNAHQGSFSPFSPAGWSAYFDGTGDYLTFPELNISSSTSFTIEFWFYWSASPSTYSMFVSDDNGNSSKYIAYNVSGATLDVQTGGSAGTTAYCSFTPILNTWYHLAFVRNTNTVTIYVNGVAQAMTQATQSGTFLDQGTINYIGRWGGTTPYAVTGYMSNFRAVVGLAVYTGNFTPSTSILGNTQSAGSNITAITSGSTFLSLQNNRFVDNGTNASAITRNGDVKIQAFSPFRNSGTYTPATHGGSVYFDGSGDYVYVTTSPAMTLGTNNHCIEFWMYPDGTQAIYACPWFYDGSIVYYFSVGSNSNESFLLVGGGAPWSLAITILSAEYLKVLNNWTHVAITRTGTAFRVIFNGRLVGYGTTSQSIAAPNPTFSIGWDLTNATTYYKGWLSNFRVINGSVPAAYQTASTTLGTTIFTPPTSVPAFEANTVMAMNFTNGGIVDASGRLTFETTGDAKISNVASKFGIGSLFFDGTGDNLRIPISPYFQFGTGDLTIECWVYLNSYNATWGSQIAGSHSYTVAADWLFSINTTGKVFFQLVSTSHTSTSSVSLTTWTHIAAVRSSGTVTLYINGSNAGGGGTNTSSVPANSYACTIGTAINGDNATALNGYIDDLRITRFARTITLPTGPFLTK